MTISVLAPLQVLSRLHVLAVAVSMLVSICDVHAQAPEEATPKVSATEQVQGGNANGESHWTTRWEFDNVDINKLAGRLKSVGIDLGIEIRGVATAKFDVGVPWTSLRDAAAYRFEGTLTSPQLTIDDVQFRDLKTSVNYRDGLVTLTQLQSSVVDASDNSRSNTPGTIEGKGTLQLVPRQDATAELSVKNLSLAKFSELIAKFTTSHKSRLPQDGSLSGEIQFQAPLDSIGDIETYELDGRIQCQRLQVAGLPPANVEIAQFAIHDGRITIDGLDLKTESMDRNRSPFRLMGKADLPLDFDGEFEFEIAGDDMPMTEITNIAFGSVNGANAIVEGKLDFLVKGNGFLAEDSKNSTWDMTGSLASPAFQFAGIDMGVLEHNIQFTPDRLDILPRRDVESLPATFKLQRFRSQYLISKDALTIESMVADLFGGKVSGTARVPRDAEGDLVANLVIDEMRPRMILPIAGKTNSTISAMLSGSLDWRVPISKLAEPTRHTGTATISATEITLGGETIGDLKADFSADEGRILLRAGGELFSGVVDVETIAEMEAGDGWSDISIRLMPSKLQFDTVSIDIAANLIAGQNLDLTGSASGEISLDFEVWKTGQSVLPTASLKLELSRLYQGSSLLSRKLSLDGKIETDVLEIQSLAGDYAGGAIRMSGRSFIFDSEDAVHPRADLQVTATQINLNHGLWFIGDSAKKLQGRVSLKATIAGYQESIRIRGSASGQELAAYDLQIGSAHSGLLANANLSSSRWDLKFPSVRSSVAGGQLEGELFLASGRRGGVDIESRWKTRRVDFFQLTNQLGRSSSLAHGEISGELSLRGKSVQALEDLAGRFDFQLQQTPGTAIPGLIAASRFLGPVSIAGQSFDVGEARGVIGQGVVVVDEFWLGSDNALVQADGKIYLRSGRMDLMALIATGDYRDITGNFAELSQKYAFRSLLPASAILSVTELFRDRTLVIAVMGTTQDPMVRLLPIETFREESARFLLREGQRLVFAAVTGGAVDGLDGGF